MKVGEKICLFHLNMLSPSKLKTEIAPMDRTARTRDGEYDRGLPIIARDVT